MKTVEEYRAIGAELKDNLLLRFDPIAVKILHSKDETPEGCYVPSRDGGKIPALCQTFGMVRRNHKSMAVFREDHWCIWPVVSLRLGEMDDDMNYELGSKFFLKDPDISRERFKKFFPRINEDLKLEGLALAPLDKVNFVPDAVVIYCDPAQARQLMMAAQYVTGEPVTATFNIVGACIQALVPVLNGEKDYNYNMPDDGEYERSLVLENETLFTVSSRKIDELMEGMRSITGSGFGHKALAMDMNLEYPRPDFYNRAMEKWGLKTSSDLWGENRV